MNTIALEQNVEDTLQLIDTALAHRVRTFLANASSADATNLEIVISEYKRIAQDAATDMNTADVVLGIIKPAYLEMKERMQGEA
ncbi:MAG: hypothetical protein ACMG57_01340 [Candidatus Dojkabacteria bacterium]